MGHFWGLLQVKSEVLALHVKPHGDLLADVLGIEHLVADFTLEAAKVPVLVQRYERLFILKLLPTAAAVCAEHNQDKGRLVDI